MVDSATPPRKGPPLWVKVLVSLVILWHFAMIFTTVTAASSPQFPASPLTEKAFAEVGKPYLQPLFMTNPYRFYAPNPNNTDHLWYRLEYEKGGVRWVDFADRDAFVNRMQYQRHLCLSFMLSSMVRFDPNPEFTLLTPQAFVCVQSYARHAARELPGVTPTGESNRVKEVDIYHVTHIVAEPVHYRLGWSVDDLRLHFPATYYGSYDPAGKRIDISGEQREFMIVRRSTSSLAALMVEDLRPLLKGLEGNALRQRMVELQIPRAVRKLIEEFPQLLTSDAGSETLAAAIRALVESRDNQEFKEKSAVPVVHYPVLW